MTMTTKSSPVDILMILDGWGINETVKGNAVAAAHTPFLDGLVADFLRLNSNAQALKSDCPPGPWEIPRSDT